MPFYTDADIPSKSDAMCISTEGGTALCGHAGCDTEITEEHIDTIWDLFLDDRLYDRCSCEVRLREHLGVPDDANLEVFARKQKAKVNLVEKRGGAD